MSTKFFKIISVGTLALALAIFTGGVARAITTVNANAVTNDGALTITGAAASTWSLSAGALTVNSGATAALTLDSGTTGAVNLGTGASAKTITIGNNTTSTGIVFTSGTGGIDITSTAAIADVLDISAASLTTADLFDIDAAAITEGDFFDITVPATRTSGTAILITDASATGVATAPLIDINVNSTATTNVLDITYATGVGPTGSAIDLNMGTNVAGDAINIASAATSGNGVVITNTNARAGGSALAITDSATATASAATTFITAATITDVDALTITTAAQTTGNTLTVNAGASVFTTGSALEVAGSGAYNTDADAGLLAVNATGIALDGYIASILANVATTIDAVLQISGNALTSGNGLVVAGTGTGLTGNLFSVTSASTGAATNGLVRFNFSGAHTNNGFQIDDATAAGTAVQLNANSATTGTALAISATALTTGRALTITATSTNTADIATNTGATILFSPTFAQSTAAQTTVLGYAGFRVNFTSNPSFAGNTEIGALIQNQVTANATDNAVAALFQIDNADTSAGGSTVITDALRITNSGAIAAGVTNGINFGSTTIATALKGTTVATDIINFTGYTVATTTGATVIAGSAEGTAALTLTTGDVLVSDGDVSIVGGQIEVLDNATSFAFIVDNTGGAAYLTLVTTNDSETMVFGHGTVDSVTVTTDGTGDAEVELPDGSINTDEILDGTIVAADVSDAMCLQVVAGEFNPTEAGATDDYLNLVDNSFSATEADENAFMVPIAVKIDNLRAEVDVAPGAGNDEWTVTVRDDLASTTLTCSIDETATNCSDAVAAASVVAGSKLAVLVTSSVGGGADPAGAAALTVSFCVTQ